MRCAVFCVAFESLAEKGSHFPYTSNRPFLPFRVFPASSSLSPLRGRLGVEAAGGAAAITSLAWRQPAAEEESPPSSWWWLAATTASAAFLWDLRSPVWRPSLRFGVAGGGGGESARENRRRRSSIVRVPALPADRLQRAARVRPPGRGRDRAGVRHAPADGRRPSPVVVGGRRRRWRALPVPGLPARRRRLVVSAAGGTGGALLGDVGPG